MSRVPSRRCVYEEGRLFKIRFGRVLKRHCRKWECVGVGALHRVGEIMKGWAM